MIQKEPQLASLNKEHFGITVQSNGGNYTKSMDNIKQTMSIAVAEAHRDEYQTGWSADFKYKTYKQEEILNAICPGMSRESDFEQFDEVRNFLWDVFGWNHIVEVSTSENEKVVRFGCQSNNTNYEYGAQHDEDNFDNRALTQPGRTYTLYAVNLFNVNNMTANNYGLADQYYVNFTFKRDKAPGAELPTIGEHERLIPTLALSFFFGGGRQGSSPYFHNF